MAKRFKLNRWLTKLAKVGNFKIISVFNISLGCNKSVSFLFSECVVILLCSNYLSCNIPWTAVLLPHQIWTKLKSNMWRPDVTFSWKHGAAGLRCYREMLEMTSNAIRSGWNLMDARRPIRPATSGYMIKKPHQGLGLTRTRTCARACVHPWGKVCVCLCVTTCVHYACGGLMAK